MTIAFRADASDVIGNGHVMRCVTLANTLVERGETCMFICRALTDQTRKAIKLGGHRLHILPGSTSRNDCAMHHNTWLAASWQDDATATSACITDMSCDWLVVDHYGIDTNWETRLRTPALKLAVIDDLADRPHDCDLLLDQNLHAEPHQRYEGLIPQHAQKLLGPRYALLRPEFEARAVNASASRNVLVAFSGADPLHLTTMAMHALISQKNVTVVANSQNGDMAIIRAGCKKNGWSLHVDASHIAALMQQAAIGIGAGGGLLWERAALGLPSIAIIVAENQRQQVLNAQAAGMVLGLEGTDVDVAALRAGIGRLQCDAELCQAMSETCRRIVDGKGRKRVAERLLEPNVGLRKAGPADSDTVWRWRNDARIRRVSRSTDTIDGAAHEKWFASVLQDQSRHLLIATDIGGPLGVVRFDCGDDGAEISIYLAPDRLGQGRGASLLLAAETWLANTAGRRLTIRADVRAGNTASGELFRSCGYVLSRGMYRKPVGSFP